MSKADLRLKSTSQNPTLVMENVIFHICKKKVKGWGYTAYQPKKSNKQS